MLSLLLLLIVFVSGISSKQKSDKTILCTRELEEVVYQPNKCAFNYFQKISNQLRLQKDVLWTPQARSTIQTFSQTYNVTVLLIDAFNYFYTYEISPTFYQSGFGATFLIQRLNTVNGAMIIIENIYVYGSKLWSSTGQLLYLIVAAPQKRFVSAC